DSIVRGTTCARIVKLLRDAGAKEVHMRISSPPFINPCYYGTDIDSKDHLIACRYGVEQITKIVGADSLGYLSIEGIKCIAGCDAKDTYCTACFDGNYPTPVPSGEQKDKFQSKISENAKK
ncbi:MAG: amidophosphoribosyltransferase, partial [Clostridia bacterium]|nr:amidophosphoribosyltransferase [Clostridia bacterium]